MKHKRRRRFAGFGFIFSTFASELGDRRTWPTGAERDGDYVYVMYYVRCTRFATAAARAADFGRRLSQSPRDIWWCDQDATHAIGGRLQADIRIRDALTAGHPLLEWAH